jgi:hypothetical protein
MVTIFKNFNEVVEHKPIQQILEEIRSGTYKHAIVYLRKSKTENKLEAYEKAKKSLPAFTPSAKFVGGRKMEFLTEYSNLIILDIDKLSPTDLKTASNLANQNEFTYVSFISPSGNGLKIIVKIDTPKTEHKESFLAVQDHYEKLLNLEIDKSGKDVTRLCFYSFDPNLYINENAAVFSTESNQSSQVDPTETSPTLNFKPATSNSEAIYNHCVKFTEKKVQYANGSRNVFVHQLACNLNRKGVSLQEALGYILTDFGYDEKEVTQAVNSAYGNSHEFGKGIELEKRHPEPVEGKKAISKSESSRAKAREYEHDDKDPSSFGGGWEEDDDKPKPTQIDRLELFLTNKYIFRHNIVSGKLEFQQLSNSSPLGRPGGAKKKWNVMNDFIENSILRECLKARIRTNISSLRNLLNSDFCPLYNPFEDYFFNLPSYDEKTDYITELANTITTTKQDLWQQCFKKWLVAMVGCVLDDKVINHTVIVFSGKQGLGKTTWVEKLVPKQLKEYLFSGTINPNNKDTLVQLSECMLINLDELENLNRSEIGSLKEIITKTQIRMRRAYGHNNETMPRRASFAGSVNTAQFLNDSTGSRRFLCFELEDIQYQHDVDINMAFSQALFLFKSDFRHWFDQEEIKNITANNEQYQLHSPEEELLLTWFEPIKKNENNQFIDNENNILSPRPSGGAGGGIIFLNASQIAAKLAEKAKINITDGTINKLGKALKKHNFIRLKKNGIAVYALIENTWEDVDNKNKIVEE